MDQWEKTLWGTKGSWFHTAVDCLQEWLGAAFARVKRETCTVVVTFSVFRFFKLAESTEVIQCYSPLWTLLVEETKKSCWTEAEKWLNDYSLSFNTTRMNLVPVSLNLRTPNHKKRVFIASVKTPFLCNLSESSHGNGYRQQIPNCHVWYNAEQAFVEGRPAENTIVGRSQPQMQGHTDSTCIKRTIAFYSIWHPESQNGILFADERGIHSDISTCTYIIIYIIQK